MQNSTKKMEAKTFSAIFLDCITAFIPVFPASEWISAIIFTLHEYSSVIAKARPGWRPFSRMEAAGNSCLKNGWDQYFSLAYLLVQRSTHIHDCKRSQRQFIGFKVNFLTISRKALTAVTLNRQGMGMWWVGDSRIFHKWGFAKSEYACNTARKSHWRAPISENISKKWIRPTRPRLLFVILFADGQRFLCFNLIWPFMPTINSNSCRGSGWPPGTSLTANSRVGQKITTVPV